MESGPGLVCEKEVRFAVVMYGGVSLAIYINGVAQELLRMVRATAPANHDTKTALPTPELSGSERVYRKVSYLLSNQDDRRKEQRDGSLRKAGEAEAAFQERLRKDKDAPARQAGESDQDYHERLKRWAWQRKWLREANQALWQDGTGSALHTRFIVDIISGTSAGGINGVFLAKALANGQNINELQQLWVDEGDIRLLINDRRSVEPPYDLQTPPASLLNSQRMYVKLLNALTGMDKGEPPADEADHCKSPYVAELDLFLTTTDIAGIPLPIKLSDRVVYERRYRNVFQFRYDQREGRNDFIVWHNPFLAYASRCTSSFPFAFEPMTLADIDDVLEHYPQYQDDEFEKARAKWGERFYQRYTQRPGVRRQNGAQAAGGKQRANKFASRAFGDGGYLDNRPFSYATETLARRTAEVPVLRKLVYIEPSPEHPECEPEKAGKPNVAENVAAALFTLPRYETIREDLQRVQDRNRLITRTQRILRQITEDDDRMRSDKPLATDKALLDKLGRDLFEEERERERRSALPGKLLTDEDWAKLDMTDIRRIKGRPYVAYLRLEIGVVTDNLAALIAAGLGCEPDSDYYQAVRALVRAWRDYKFIAYRRRKKKTPTTQETLNAFLVDFDVTYSLRRLSFLRDRIDHTLRGTRLRLHLEAREELSALRTFINGEHRTLLQFKLALASELANEIRNSGITQDDLDDILNINHHKSGATASSKFADENRNTQQEEEGKARALDLYQRKKELRDKFDAITDKLRERYRRIKRQSDYACLNRLTTGCVRLPADLNNTPAVKVRKRLLRYYQNYDEYDMLILPVQQGTDIGESSLTEITRISPEDATNLINEKEAGCLKLAGTAFGHFGAFMQESWRRNDILWGRLDGAERLIAALLPDEPELAQQLTTEAQVAIIYETVEKMGDNEMHGLLAESLMRIKAKRPAPETLTRFIDKLVTIKDDADEIILKRIRQNDLRDFYLEHYPKRSRLEPEPALRSAARATTVVGQMLDQLSEQYSLNNKPAMWVTRLGKIFWGMVEVAAPGSIAGKMFRHWLKLIYLFEVLLIVAGAFLPKSELGYYGRRALGLTLAVNVAVLLLDDMMSGRVRWRIIKGALVVMLTALAALGVVHVRNSLWPALAKTFSKGTLEEVTRYWQQQKPALAALIELTLGGLLLFLLARYGPSAVKRFNRRLARFEHEMNRRIERMNDRR